VDLVVEVALVVVAVAIEAASAVVIEALEAAGVIEALGVEVDLVAEVVTVAEASVAVAEAEVALLLTLLLDQQTREALWLSKARNNPYEQLRLINEINKIYIYFLIKKY